MQFKFREDVLASKNYVPWASVQLYARSCLVSRFGKTPTCNGQSDTDKQSLTYKGDTVETMS